MATAPMTTAAANATHSTVTRPVVLSRKTGEARKTASTSG